MLRLTATLTLLLALGPRLAGLSWRQLSVALAIALAAGPALLALATLHGKGPYLVYTLVWLLGAAAVAGTARAELAWLKPVALAAPAVGLASTVQVAVHWGGAAAWTPAAMAVALLAAVALACLRPRGPPKHC